MRSRVFFLFGAAALALAGCGSAGHSTERTASRPDLAPSTTPPAAEAITIDEPTGEVPTIGAMTFVVRGRSTLEQIIVHNFSGSTDPVQHPDSGRSGFPEYRVEVRSDGRWSQSVPIFTGSNQITARDPRGTASATVEIFRETGGAPPSTEGKRAPSLAVRHRANVRRLLAEQGAVGRTAAAVRAALGAPDDARTIDGQRFWDYDKDGGGRYHLAFERGIVVAVDPY